MRCNSTVWHDCGPHIALGVENGGSLDDALLEGVGCPSGSSAQAGTSRPDLSHTSPRDHAHSSRRVTAQFSDEPSRQ